MYDTSKKRSRPEINMLPLVDVIFILLLFFMLTTSFSQSSGIEVDLPEASSSVATVDQEYALTIVVTAAGEWKLDTRILSEDSMREELKRWWSENRERPQAEVIIQADEQSPHGRVVRLIDFAKESGISLVRIATKG
jgi:biopolymer transport protein ExbD